jgi:hypothetical protein
MKNRIIIDVDTERKEKVTLFRDNGSDAENKKTSKESSLNDISTALNGLMVLIEMADNNGVDTMENLSLRCIRGLTEVINRKKESFEKND